MRQETHYSDLVLLWLESKISSEEFTSKTNSFDEASDLIESVDKIRDFVVPSNKSKMEAWREIEEKIANQPSDKIIPIYRRRWVGIAASFILVLSALFLFKQSHTNPTSIETSVAEFQSVYLPDSSIVHLNAGSQISYVQNDWANNRELELSGEAFFEVKKGSDFVVKTGLGNVMVVGTSFNVKVLENTLEVACKTGKVKVINVDESDFEMLTPGLKTIVVNNTVKSPIEVQLSDIGLWQTGEFYFEGVLFEEVLVELQKQFDITIDFDSENFEDGPYTTLFNRNNLEEALQLVCYPKGLEYTIDGKAVKIAPKKIQKP